MDFITIDVETANSDMASICQIGIAAYSNNQLIKEWCTLINPNDYFDSINVGIHGIEDYDVEDAPQFTDIYKVLSEFLQGSILICHTHFDRVALNKTCSKNGLKELDVSWLDSSRVARRAWPEFAKKGYGLKNLCEHIGYQFEHHDALEDAKAAGQIIIEAINVSGLTLEAWQKRVTQPIDPNNSSIGQFIARDGNPEGILYGETAVFTGALDITRKDAANLAANAGCNVTPNVNTKTTLLVVGDVDLSRTAGKSRTSKYLKAENYIEKGQSIKIISESDFKYLLSVF